MRCVIKREGVRGSDNVRERSMGSKVAKGDINSGGA